MSTITYFERHGQRFEVDPATLKTELRCDGCGEFVADTDAVHGVIQLTGPGLPVTHISFDAHPLHSAAAVQAIGERMAAERDA
jgi:hypothetical protein